MGILERNEQIPETVEVIKEYVDTGKGHMISTTCFRPKSVKTELKGMICYCPGYSSFTDWTDTDCAINFVQRGYIFVTLDHYGHGRSDGDWLTNPTNSHNHYVDDAVYIFERAKRKFTPKQYIEKEMKLFHYYLLGHSLGGAVAIEASKRYTSSSYYLMVEKRIKKNHKFNEKISRNNKNDYIPETLLETYCNNDINVNVHNLSQDTLYGWDGLILSAPMVKIKDEMKPPQFLIDLAWYLVPLLPDARIVPTQSLVDKLTRDQTYFEMVKNNPLAYDDRPALRTAFVLKAFCDHIEKEMDKVKLPIFIMHGENDKVTDPAMSQLLYDKCSSKEKKIKVFKGAFHALLIDTCRKQVFDEIDAWIQQRNKLNKLS